MKNSQIHSPKLGIFLTSLAILFILGFQFYTARHLREFWPKFRKLQALHKMLNPPSDPALWPFMSYPMYSYPNYLGDKIKQYSIYGVLENDNEVQILPEDLGINYWIFMYSLKEALRKKNYEEIKNFAQLYEIKNQKDLISLQLRNTPFVLTEKGLVSEPQEIVTDINLRKLEEKLE